MSKPKQAPKPVFKSNPTSAIKINENDEITQVKKVSPQMTKSLIDARVGKKWTQIQLAHASGVDIKTLNEIERGGCIYNADIFNKLTKALGVKIERNYIIEQKN